MQICSSSSSRPCCLNSRSMLMSAPAIKLSAFALMKTAASTSARGATSRSHSALAASRISPLIELTLPGQSMRMIATPSTTSTGAK